MNDVMISLLLILIVLIVFILVRLVDRIFNHYEEQRYKKMIEGNPRFFDKVSKRPPINVASDYKIDKKQRGGR